MERTDVRIMIQGLMVSGQLNELKAELKNNLLETVEGNPEGAYMVALRLQALSNVFLLLEQLVVREDTNVESSQ